MFAMDIYLLHSTNSICPNVEKCYLAERYNLIQQTLHFNSTKLL